MCEMSIGASGSASRSSAGMPSAFHGSRAPAALAIVGSTSIVRTARSSMRPSGWPGSLTKNGTGAMTPTFAAFAGTARLAAS